MHFTVQGAKGASAPHEADDTLKSTQAADIIDLLGEGQIGGLVNGLKSVYLDGVPVENSDGSRNFSEFGYQVTLGGPTTEADSGFGDVQTEVGVGVTVLAAVPVVRTITDTTADKVRVTITVPQLAQTQDNGDRVGAAFDWAIDVQSNGGGYVQKWIETISGKASSTYSRAVVVDLKAAGPAPWDVRVRRITADSTTSNLSNAFAWGSYTVIGGVRMLYRHSAVVRLQFDAKNFSSVPARWYDVMGVSDWDVPVNYDPLLRTVSGSWNGLFKQAWTNNPAWVLFNLIKHPRYGLGQYVDLLPDKWVLYQLAQWCDVPLPDGRGGTEPRYSINVAITEQSEALQLLAQICSVFRGVMMQSGASLSVTWDAPGSPVASYAPANVVDGLFSYADGSSAAKRTSCTCWYTDRSQAAVRVPATWDDPDLVAKYGVRNMEINPLGVATPAQALRMAKWALYTSHYSEQTVSFRTGAEGAARRLGEVFQITDPSETGERLGGRIHSATTDQLTLDSAVTLLSGETYTVWVTQPHPTQPDQLVQESRTVTNAPGAAITLTVSPAFSAAPVVGTVWVLEGSNVAPTLWRYVSIVEAKGEGGGIEYEVGGIRHVPGLWDLVERDQPLTARPGRRLTYAVAPPTGLTLAEVNYVDGGVRKIRATASWQASAPGLRHLVMWRLQQGPWTTLPLTSSNTVDINNLQPGLLEVMVRSQNGLGIASLAATASLVLTGNGALPPNVTGLGANTVATGVQLVWNPNTATNAGETELRSGASWAAATLLWRGRASNHTMVSPPAGSYTIWAKHHDNTGLLESASAASVAFAWTGTALLKRLDLVAESQIFKIAVDGSGSPASITLTASGQSLAGAPVFSVVAGTGTLAGSGVTRSLNLTSMTSETITVQVDWDGLTDQVTIVKVRDGSDALTVLLANEFIGVACDAAGTVSSGQLPLGTTMLVYRGATLLTSGVTYGSSGVSGLSGVSISGAGVISVGGVTADNGSAVFSATVGTVTIPRTLRVTKVRQGGSGQSNHRIYVAGTPSTPPTTPSPTSNGATPAGWSATPVAITAGQAQWQSDGTTPAGSTTTTWSDPYLSYFKVGQLSAIAADLGTITAGRVSGVTFDVQPGGGINYVSGATTLAKQSMWSISGRNHFLLQNLSSGGGLVFETYDASVGAGRLMTYTSAATAQQIYRLDAPANGSSIESSQPLTISAAPLKLTSTAGLSLILGTLFQSGNVRVDQELVLNGTSAQLRLAPVAGSSSGVGTFWRNDGSDLFLLKTMSGDALGSWTAARPIIVHLGSTDSYSSSSAWDGWVEVGKLRLRDMNTASGGSGAPTRQTGIPGGSTTGVWVETYVNGTWGYIEFFPRT